MTAVRSGGVGGYRLPVGTLLAAGAFAALVFAEHRHPLRARTEAPLRHDLRNLAVAGLSALTLRLLERPLVVPLARAVERRGWGLLPRLGLPRPIEIAAGVLLMDYTLYLWHVLTHRVPFLWRLHSVHHVDRDLTASTAIRFHFGEMALSVPYRAAQVLAIGVGPRALGIWQNLLFASIVFHHSNLRLPPVLERALLPLIVTPRMHGIHHSVLPEESDSNWSSGLTIWDRLHGTLRLDRAGRQRKIEIGVAGYRDPADVTLPKILAMPFEPEHRRLDRRNGPDLRHRGAGPREPGSTGSARNGRTLPPA